jgi:hypothetical protein
MQVMVGATVTVSIAMPVTSRESGLFVLHARALPGNFDGQTLGPW